MVGKYQAQAFERRRASRALNEYANASGGHHESGYQFEIRGQVDSQGLREAVSISDLMPATCGYLSKMPVR